MRYSIQLVRVVLAVTAGAGVVALAAACSSNETAKSPTVDDAAADAPVLEPADPIEPAETAPPACTLASSFKTGVKVCDDCLEKSCCLVIKTCFGDKPCSDLNDCYNGCNSKHGRTDAGAQCVRDCATGKEEAATKLYDMLECQSSRCLADCKQ